MVDSNMKKIKFYYHSPKYLNDKNLLYSSSLIAFLRSYTSPL